MIFLHKLKEVASSMLPIVAIVLILNFTVVKMESALLIAFFVGLLLVLLGQVLFLVGVDNGVLPMGGLVGSSVTRQGKVWFVLMFGLVFGFVATMAEPDLQVLAGQVSGVDPAIGKYLLMAVVSAGVGIFVALALLRILKGFRLRIILLITYAVVFALAIAVHFVSPDFFAVAFDSGGVTTGPISVPFILSLGVGVASVRAGSKSEDSFGIVGLASAGPILSILILGLFFPSTGEAAAVVTEAAAHTFGDVILSTLADVAIGLSPMIVIFLFFNFLFIKLPKRQLLKLMVGALITFLGLWFFLTGVEYGFSASGTAIGEVLGGKSFNWILIVIGAVIGTAIVYTEPSIKVLGSQVEQVTNGHIGKNMLLNSLAASIAVAVALGVLRALYGLSLWWFIAPGYVLALGLMFFSPPLFTAIAFDSGGVASGTMTATFVLPFIMGICAATGHSVLEFAFGIVALIAMMPIVMLQILGIAYKVKEKRLLRKGSDAGEDIETIDFLMPEDVEEIEDDIDLSGV